MSCSSFFSAPYQFCEVLAKGEVPEKCSQYQHDDPYIHKVFLSYQMLQVIHLPEKVHGDDQNAGT
jgi:hypothetical protein